MSSINNQAKMMSYYLRTTLLQCQGVQRIIELDTKGNSLTLASCVRLYDILLNKEKHVTDSWIFNILARENSQRIFFSYFVVLVILYLLNQFLSINCLFVYLLSICLFIVDCLYIVLEIMFSGGWGVFGFVCFSFGTILPYPCFKMTISNSVQERKVGVILNKTSY